MARQITVNEETKVLVFDMDGTIADLYGVENWLPKLRAYDPTPYATATPLFDMVELVATLKELQKIGYIIAITSWLSLDATNEYNKAVRKAKKEWLENYNFPYDEIHLVKYGTTKANCTRHLGGTQILFDDSEVVRNGWSLGAVVNPTETNIIDYLKALL